MKQKTMPDPFGPSPDCPSFSGPTSARSARKQKRRPQKTSVEKFLSKFFSGAELLNAEGPR
ncbi:hypothetical protein, partial [uncultured Mailhella sp.]|uniref:hypothetical protein n=1 Tax=uncultured Mailhella sp. TaxID=1981031 RepID=UPI0025DAF7A0